MSMAPKRGLGRGMDVLIPGSSRIKDEKGKDLHNMENNPKPKRASSPSKTRAAAGTGGKKEKTDGKEIVKEVEVIKEVPVVKEVEVIKEVPVIKEVEVVKEVPAQGERMMKLSEIEPLRDQPRKQFNEDALLELAESIRQFGVLQPLLVQKEDGYYSIIAGERRWRAARLAGLAEVPVVVREFDRQERFEAALIENLQREDLNPIEEAQAYRRLMEEFSLRQDEIAERVSKSRTAVTNAMRLLKLNDDVQQMVIDEMLTSGHARALLAIENPGVQYQVAMKVFDEKLSVRETEDLVRSVNRPRKEKLDGTDPVQFIYESYEDRLEHILGTKVTIKRRKKGGRIQLEYYSNEELERLLDLFDAIPRREEEID